MNPNNVTILNLSDDAPSGNTKFLSSLIALISIVTLPLVSFAQWTTSASDIYNSNAGNVGIGITPTAKFHLNGAMKIQGANTLEFGAGVTKESNAGKIGYQTFSDGLDIVGAGTSGVNRKIRFWAEGGAYFTGNVAIFGQGLAGSGALQNTDGTYFTMTSLFNDRSIRMKANNSVFDVNPDGSYEWYSAPFTRMFITTNGNVGIGTKNADFKLTVNGKIKCEEIQVIVDVPGDYVFEKDYNLMPLSEVEDFITKQKHLPNVPSATELVKNGYEVGEMTNKLMEKVEELTLYVIQLKKENEKLKERVGKLEK